MVLVTGLLNGDVVKQKRCTKHNAQQGEQSAVHCEYLWWKIPIHI